MSTTSSSSSFSELKSLAFYYSFGTLNLLWFQRFALNIWKLFEFLFRCLLKLHSVWGVVLNEYGHLGHFNRFFFRGSKCPPWSIDGLYSKPLLKDTRIRSQKSGMRTLYCMALILFSNMLPTVNILFEPLARVNVLEVLVFRVIGKAVLKWNRLLAGSFLFFKRSCFFNFIFD